MPDAASETRRLWRLYLAQCQQMLSLVGDRHGGPNESEVVQAVTRLMGEQCVTLALLLGIQAPEPLSKS